MEAGRTDSQSPASACPGLHHVPTGVAGSDPATGSQRRPAHRSSIALSAVPHAPLSNCCSAEWRARSEGHRPQNKIPASCPARRSRGRHDRKAKRAGVEGDLALVSMRGVDASYVHLSGLIIRRRKKARKKQANKGSKRTREQGKQAFQCVGRGVPPFTNASIAVSTHSRLTNGLWSVLGAGVGRTARAVTSQGPGRRNSLRRMP